MPIIRGREYVNLPRNYLYYRWLNLRRKYFIRRLWENDYWSLKYEPDDLVLKLPQDIQLTESMLDDVTVNFKLGRRRNGLVGRMIQGAYIVKSLNYHKSWRHVTGKISRESRQVKYWIVVEMRCDYEEENLLYVSREASGKKMAWIVKCDWCVMTYFVLTLKNTVRTLESG